MILYLDSDLIKSSPAPGNYVGRVQTGRSDDGSPIYKYFYDAEEYQKYMANKREGASKDTRKEAEDKHDEPKLKDKVSEEHEESKEKTTKPKNKVEKSLYLNLTKTDMHFLRVD